MTRKGMVLPLIVALMVVALLALTVFHQTVRQEARSTHKLVRTLHAEAICDMAVSRLAGIVSQKPWEDRFYLTPPLARYAFDQDRFPFGNEGPEYAAGDAQFSGWIKDVDALDRRYRVMVWSTYQGVSVMATYDLRYCRGALGPLNRTCLDLRAVKTDDLPLPTVADGVMDAIPIEVHKPENLVPGLPAAALPATFTPPETVGPQVAGVVEGTIEPAYTPPVAEPVNVRPAVEQAPVAASTTYDQALVQPAPTLKPTTKTRAATRGGVRTVR